MLSFDEMKRREEKSPLKALAKHSSWEHVSPRISEIMQDNRHDLRKLAHVYGLGWS